jgi:hypothetical protein
MGRRFRVDAKARVQVSGMKRSSGAAVRACSTAPAAAPCRTFHVEASRSQHRRRTSTTLAVSLAQELAFPTVSATCAPRLPSGLGAPVVVSRAV